MIAYQTPEERPLSPAQMQDYHTTSLKTWIGGYRHRPQDWTEPKNWYPHGVPSWADKVIIGGYGRHKCILDKSVDDISALSVLQGATLEIESNGRLTVDGILADKLGILGDSGMSNYGILVNQGTLSLRNAAIKGIHNEGLIHNSGKIYADSSISTCSKDWGKFTDRGERVFLLPM